MGQPVNSLMTLTSTSVFMTEGFLREIEFHLEYLKTHPETVVFTVTPVEAQKFEGDFYGLCQVFNIPRELHQIALRVSGFEHPLDYSVPRNGTDIRPILLPSTNVLNQIAEKYNQVLKLR